VGTVAAIGAGILALGGGGLWVRIADYLDSALPIDSTAGLVVFRVGGGYLSYRPFELGIEPWLLAAGTGMRVAAAFLAAVLRRPKMGYTRRR
jgi:hypothetical protein